MSSDNIPAPRPMDGQSDPVTLKLYDTPQPSHVMDMRDIALPDETVYRLFRALPKALPGLQDDTAQSGQSACWPSLWLLDGNAAFDRLDSAVLARHPGLAVIGIGYPMDQPFDRRRRGLDYVAPPQRRDPKRPDRTIGGADAFLARLTGPLRAEAERDAGIDPTRRMLAGHSYAGLFTLYAAGGLSGFARFAAISPSLWLVPDWKVPHPTGPLDVIVGDRERQRSLTAEPAAPLLCVPSEARQLMQNLHARRADSRLHVLAGQTHGDTLAGAQPLLMDIAGR